MIQLKQYNSRQLSPELYANMLDRYQHKDDTVVLATCQRFEIYSGTSEIQEDIAEHLFQVSAGLKSNFLGDPAIQGQVKKAYLHAQERVLLNKYMHRLFQTALQTGKQVRTSTPIARGAVTYSQATVNQLRNDLGKLTTKKGLIIGASPLTTELIKLLQKMGMTDLALVNRGKYHGTKMATKHSIPFIPLDKLEFHCKTFDFTITSTSSPFPILFDRHLRVTGRYLIDLAIPADVNQPLYQRNDIQIRTLKDIEKNIAQNLTNRESAIEEAEKIIRQQIKELMLWQERTWKFEYAHKRKIV